MIGTAVLEKGFSLLAGICSIAAGAIVLGLADGVFGGEHRRPGAESFAELEWFTRQIVDGAHGVGRFCLLFAGCGGSDFEAHRA
jgi:hypothetical protein